MFVTRQPRLMPFHANAITFPYMLILLRVDENYQVQVSVDAAHHVIIQIQTDHADKEDSQCLPSLLNKSKLVTSTKFLMAVIRGNTVQYWFSL
jgi:hypothetical protein